MTKVTIDGMPGKQFRHLDFGDVCVHDGLLYVRTKPFDTRNGHMNAVGIGHEGVCHLWLETVSPVAEIAVKMKEGE